MKTQVGLLALALALLFTGCQTPTTDDQYAGGAPEKLSLREGDSIRIIFPGAPELNTVQQIRRDGNITLPLAGELKAADLSTAELEKAILKAFGDQLVTKQVNVTFESGAFPVFVSGAVLRPGRVVADRPMTPLQAIMEAGGFDNTKANTKAVRIIRHESGRVQNFTLNLQRVLDGKETSLFYLKPSDIVFVPEKFSWF